MTKKYCSDNDFMVNLRALRVINIMYYNLKRTDYDCYYH